MNFDIVLLGNFSKDRIVLPNGDKIEKPGGGVYYGAFPLKKLGVNVGVCTKLARDDFGLLFEFKEKNIPLMPIETASTVSIENIYPEKDMGIRQQRILAQGEKIKAEEVPLFKTIFIHFTSLLNEIPLELIKKFFNQAKISLDVQGFTRKVEGTKIVRQAWLEKEKILRYVTILKLDLEEGEILTGKKNPEDIGQSLIKFGPREILITSDKGVYLYTAEKFYFREFKPVKIVGRTGRGDTCIACYLAKRLNEAPEEALDFAAKIVTLKLEKEGPYK